MGALTPQLFSACPDTEVVFLLGPSPMRAVEAYSMTCSKYSASNGEGPGSQPEQTHHAAAASRAVLRKLILATAAGPEGPASRGEQLLL
jgi:hypothetical protein